MSLKVEIIPVTPFQQNCSLLWCSETSRVAIVDPGGDLDRIVAQIEKHKLIPEKIEEKLSTHIPRRYFVYGQADDVLGEKVVLYVEGEPIAIDEEVFSVLDKYEKPKNIIFIPKFTVTATGKIVRKESIDSL